MTIELKKGYTIDSYYDKNTRSYITTLRDEDGNQVRDAYYSGNMTDRNADVQFIKEFFYKYTLPSLSKTKEIEEVEDKEEEVIEESIEDKIEDTKKKTKKAKLPALSTLSPIMPDAAAGIETFNSGVGLSEEYLNRDELIYRLKRMGFKYKYDKYSDKQLYRIYQERKATLDKRAREKAEKEKKQRTIDRMIDKLEQVDYDEDSDTYSDGNYYKDGIEFESEEAAREYFGESMENKIYLNDLHEAWDIEDSVEKVEENKTLNEGLKKPKYLNTVFASNVKKAMENGDLTFDNIEEWEIAYNDGKKPNPPFNTRELMDYFKAQMNEEYKFKTINEGLKYFERKAFNEECKDYQLEVLYESVKDNLDASDIKKLGKFINKADNAEEITTYIKGLLTEDVDGFDLNKYYKLAEDISNYATSRYDVWQNDIYDISKLGNVVEIKFYVKGDWKHDHLRFEHAAQEFIRDMHLASTYPEVETYEFWEEEIDSDDEYDSDYYPAIHTLAIEVSDGNVDESLKESKEMSDEELMQSMIKQLHDRLGDNPSKSQLQSYNQRVREIRKMFTESLNEDYVEEWWGQTEESPYDFASAYNLEIEKLDSEMDSTLYRFVGSKSDIDKAKNAGYFYDPEYESSSEPIRDEDQALKELIERLAKVGFILDESVTPIKDNMLGGKHLQVINPNLHYPARIEEIEIEDENGKTTTEEKIIYEYEGEEIDEETADSIFRDDLKEVEYVLDSFNEVLGRSGYVTFNFGPRNKDLIITGGIDIRFK